METKPGEYAFSLACFECGYARAADPAQVEREGMPSCPRCGHDLHGEFEPAALEFWLGAQEG